MLGTIQTPIDRILRWDPVEEAKSQLAEMEGEFNEGHVEELAKRLDEKFRSQKVESLKELNETYNGMSWNEFLDKVDNSLIGFEKVWHRESPEYCEILFYEKTRSILLFGEGIRQQVEAEIAKTDCCSANHKLWVKRDNSWQWIEASKVKSGDTIGTKSGDTPSIKYDKINLRRACMTGVLKTSEQPDVFLVDLKSCLRKGDKLFDLGDGDFRILLDMTDALTYRVLVLDLLPGKKWAHHKIPIDTWLLSKADHDESNRDYAVMMKLLRAKVESLPKEVKELFTDED